MADLEIEIGLKSIAMALVIMSILFLAGFMSWVFHDAKYLWLLVLLYFVK